MMKPKLASAKNARPLTFGDLAVGDVLLWKDGEVYLVVDVRPDASGRWLDFDMYDLVWAELDGGWHAPTTTVITESKSWQVLRFAGER